MPKESMQITSAKKAIAKLIEKLNQRPKARVLLIGDLILDEYYTGDAERISPEAPVPIIKIEKKDTRLGGAGLVAASLTGLGAEVLTVGIIGGDTTGSIIKKMLDEAGINTKGIFIEKDIITPLKQRIIGLAQHRIPQQLLRVDFEEPRPLNKDTVERIKEYIRSVIDYVDAIAIEDYNKFIFVENDIIKFIVENSKNTPIIVDPAKLADYKRYSSTYIITPNRLEASIASNIDVRSIEDAIKAGKVISKRYNIKNVLLTLDKDGIVIVNKTSAIHIPTTPREVFDNTGAGDVVLATLTYALAEGLSIEEAAVLANIAGGWEVEQRGAVPITRTQLKYELANHRREHKEKLIDRKDLANYLEILKAMGKKIVFTNGCFDLLHPGHVSYLEFARRCGDVLIVGMNSDESVRQIKGPARPLIPQEARARMLAALEAVDYVVIFDEPSVIDLIKEIKPDVLVKGQDYTVEGVVGHEFVQSYGGKVILAPIEHKYSTTSIIEEILKKYKDSVP